MLHDAVVDVYPGYSETMRNAPPLAPGTGRVVVFYPRLPMAGFNPVPFSGPGGFAIVKLTIDTDETSVGDQTFVFVDLPAGLHQLTYTRGGLLANNYSISLDVKEGKTIFVEIVSEQLKEGYGQIVPADQAQQLLTSIHHNYKQPLPFNRQPGGARPAM